MIQSHGTGVVGAFMGPITIVWFSPSARRHRADREEPRGARGRGPHARGALHAGLPAARLPRFSGAVFLALTGGEALYADMGHFSKRAIRIAWFTIVMPALLLNYFGQAAFVLANPAGDQESVLSDAAGWALLPMVVLATAAAVIASQACISGAFSMTRQAIQLGYIPRLEILHTSSRAIGQIYVPFVNWSSSSRWSCWCSASRARTTSPTPTASRSPRRW
jgi:KUP system potassium uptake protein